MKIVEVSGFEALPADLAVQLAADTAQERWDERLAEVDLEVSVQRPPGMPRPSDMLSGGTLQSLAAIDRQRRCLGGHRPGRADHRPGARRARSPAQPDRGGRCGAARTAP